MRRILTIILFFLLALLLIQDCHDKYSHHRRLCKGLLMPAVIAIYFLNMHSFSWLQLAAMISGWLGDLFLLRDEKPFFTAGCLAFMAGHIFYGILYFHEIDLNLMPRVLMAGAAVYVLYAALIYRKLRPHIPSDFKGYARFYMFFITLMSFTALMRLHSVPFESWILTWIGSMVFMVSDTLVAFEKFVRPDLKGVMETYVPAQVLLMMGEAVH